MRYLTLVCLSAVFVANASPVQAQNRQRGTVLGGLTGAAAGAIIGENSGEAGAGAAIGGLVGAVAGSALGDARDQEMQHYYAAQQQRLAYQQQYRQHYVQTQAVSLQDIVSMARSGISDGVIITQIQNRGLQNPVQVNEIVYLSQNGVSENVIRAMQQTGTVATARSSRIPTVVSQPPVIIHRYGHPHCCGSRTYYSAPPNVASPVYRGSYYYWR